MTERVLTFTMLVKVLRTFSQYLVLAGMPLMANMIVVITQCFIALYLNYE